MKLRILLSLIAISVAAPLARSQEASLRPDYSKASTYREEETVEIKQQLSIAGQDVNTSISTTTTSKVTVAPYDADGWAKVTTEVTGLKAKITTPIGDVVFDSSKPDEGADNPQLGPVKDQFKALLNTKMTYQISKDLKAGDVENPPAGAGAGEVKAQVQTSLDSWPDKPVKPGDTWEREVRQTLGQGQALVFKRRYTYVGPEARSTVSSTRRLEKVTAEDLEAKLVIDPASGNPATIDKSDLKVTSSKRTLLFDPLLGRSIEASGDVTVAGDIALGIMGQQLEGKLNLVMKIGKKEL